MKGFEEWEKLSNITFQIVPHKVNLGFNIFSDTLVREDMGIICKLETESPSVRMWYVGTVGTARTSSQQLHQCSQQFRSHFLIQINALTPNVECFDTF